MNNNIFIRTIINNHIERNLMNQLHHILQTHLENEIANESFNNQKPKQIKTTDEYINSLENQKVNQEMIDNEEFCCICTDKFNTDEDYIQLPCNHKFHNCDNENCGGLISWLNTNNTCPICRHELPGEEIITQDTQNQDEQNQDEQNQDTQNQDTQNQDTQNQDEQNHLFINRLMNRLMNNNGLPLYIINNDILYNLNPNQQQNIIQQEIPEQLEIPEQPENQMQQVNQNEIPDQPENQMQPENPDQPENQIQPVNQMQPENQIENPDQPENQMQPVNQMQSENLIQPNINNILFNFYNTETVTEDGFSNYEIELAIQRSLT
jgi:hypothetical protein